MLTGAARRTIRRDALGASSSSRNRCPSCLYRFSPSRYVTLHTSSAQSALRRKPVTTPRVIAPPSGIRLFSRTAVSASTGDHAPDSLGLDELEWSEELFQRADGPLVIHDILATRPPITYVTGGIGGDAVELHQNLFASLRVGRRDRARELIRRLAKMYQSTTPELLAAYAVYVKDLVDAFSRGDPDVTMDTIDTYVQQEMRSAGIEPDGQVFAQMIHAAMANLKEPTRTEKVKQYLSDARARGDKIFQETMTSPVYSPAELNELIRLQPDYFDPLSGEQLEALDEQDADPYDVAIEGGTDSVPHVKAVLQKGLGLETLTKSLSVLDKRHPIYELYDHLPGTKEEKDKQFAILRQRQLEEDEVDASIERWREEHERMKERGVHAGLSSKSMGALLWEWHNALTPIIEAEILQAKHILDKDEPHEGNALLYAPYLEQFHPERLSALAIMGILAEIGIKRQLKASHFVIKLSELAESEYLKEGKHRLKRAGTVRQRTNLLRTLSKAETQFPESDDSNELLRDVEETMAHEIPSHVKIRIGALLLEKVLSVATVRVTRVDPATGETLSMDQPAFSHTMGVEKGKKFGKIVVNEAVVEKMEKEPTRGSISSRLPMLVEPKPWRGYRDGGYLLYPTHAVRGSHLDPLQRAYIVAASERGDMDIMYSALDVLGKTAWQINRKIFDVMLEVWNSGEGIAGISPEDLDIPEPEQPPPEADIHQKIKYVRELKRIANLRSGAHSERCFQNFQMEIARAYLDETFYYPHSVDFRGRAYPVPPILNHIGADPARGLLIFAKGKELGAAGLSWLKIHLSNVFGYDKASLSEREEFTMEHLDDIFDSAKNPLTGRRWWTKAEDPWQCLAACFELTAALDSPDPTKYASQLPVHQDGTCNGLQHYAALGGDEVGASQVNLEPKDRPADIYTAVANLVKEYVEEDYAAGHPLAQIAHGNISRKVVKQTVMTNVYGVTFSGARLQVLARLKEVVPDFQPTPEVLALDYVATYIAKYIFKALRTMFNGAHDIQYWLGACAERITSSVTREQMDCIEEREAGGDWKRRKSKYRVTQKSTKSPGKGLQFGEVGFKSAVIWTTPLRMPVVQPYREEKSKQIKTSLQSFNIQHPHPADIVAKRKQLQAFPPNFIHSLDATHMALSALKCHEIGLTFAAVHDSFWTHACDVPTLSVVLRDAFVRVHCEDVIGRLKEEFEKRYAGSLFLHRIPIGSATAGRILIWRGKGPRGLGRTGELLLEYKRQKLLASDDPAKRKEGEEMETPATIYQRYRYRDPALAESVTEFKPTLPGTDSAGPGADEVSATVDAADEEIEAEAKEDEETEAEVDMDEEEDGAVKKIRASRRRKPGSMHNFRWLEFWMPIEFPPVPKKGSFDVRRLKESRYFFS